MDMAGRQAPRRRVWFELALECERTGVDAVCEVLEAADPLSVTLEDAGDEPQFEPCPGQTPLWPRVRVRGLFGHRIDPEAVRVALSGAAGVTELHAREVADRDWIALSREDVEPIGIGSLWIGPGWMTRPPGRIALRLEPGLAFGSGRHPTTRLCLERLAAAPPAGLDVIDYGCGSGVLAVAAALLGARRVTALDVDPQARRATAENARINGVSDRVDVAAAGADLPLAGFVVANILAGTLVDLAPVLAAATAPGGGLALSGILDAQAEEVAAAYRDAFDVRAGASREGWTRLDGRRRGG